MTVKFHPFTKLAAFSVPVEISWEDSSVTDELREAKLRFPGGLELVIYKHQRCSTVQVKNGPFTTGREWYTVVGDTLEYGTLKAIIDAYKDRLHAQAPT